jgi:glycosyltransferase involved in cell wall biosynthesis
VCYCHNPFRYAWSEREATLRARPLPLRLPLGVLLSRWRQWDWIAAQRVDRYVANSHVTAARVRRFFGREADVLHPPVELERFAPGPVGDHYLVVAELMPHKRITVAVEAFNRLRMPLVVVGDGPELRRLRRLAGPTVTFAGRASDRRVADLMRSARALVVTAAEEFGIAAVEALASGRPVIALGAGGVLESVKEGETGAYYHDSTPEALARIVAEFDPLTIDPAVCVAAGRRFGAPRFQAGLRAIVAESVAAERAPRPDERPAVVTGLLARRGVRRAATGS